MLPDNAPDTDASLGMFVGPPPLTDLSLPDDVEVELHNQLFARRIFTVADVKARPMDVFAALQAALKVETNKIIELYSRPAVSVNGTEKQGRKNRR